MPAQVAQGVVLDIYTIQQDLPLLMVIEARHQTGQGRLTAAGTADQGHHLPWLSNKADVVQHRFVGAWILKAQVTDF